MATLTFATATGNRRVRKHESRLTLNGYFTGNVTTSSKWRFVMPCDGVIRTVVMNAENTGSGTGSTTIQVSKNGTDIALSNGTWSLASTDNGVFNAPAINPTMCGVRAGDVIQVAVTAIPSTTGHGNVSFTVIIG